MLAAGYIIQEIQHLDHIREVVDVNFRQTLPGTSPSKSYDNKRTERTTEYKLSTASNDRVQ